MEWYFSSHLPRKFVRLGIYLHSFYRHVIALWVFQLKHAKEWSVQISVHRTLHATNIHSSPLDRSSLISSIVFQYSPRPILLRAVRINRTTWDTRRNEESGGWVVVHDIT